MKRKYSIFICVVLMAIFLTACGNTDSPESDSSAVVESIVPDESIIEEDPFADVRDSDELWLAYGLAAYEENKEPVNLKDLFSDMINTTYLTLYDHWFVYDKESVIHVELKPCFGSFTRNMAQMHFLTRKSGANIRVSGLSPTSRTGEFLCEHGLFLKSNIQVYHII